MKHCWHCNGINCDDDVSNAMKSEPLSRGNSSIQSVLTNSAEHIRILVVQEHHIINHVFQIGALNGMVSSTLLVWA